MPKARQHIVYTLVKALNTTIYKLIQALVSPLYIKTIIGSSLLCSLFLFVAMQKERVNRERKTRVFICNPADCSSPDGRTMCRCSILSLARERVSRSDRRGAKILQSFTVHSYSLALNGITLAEFFRRPSASARLR